MCTVTGELNGGGTASSSFTSKPLKVVEGIEISGDNLSGAKVGETVSFTAQLQLPPGYNVTTATWRKYIDGSYKAIVEDGMFLRVDPSRYNLQVSLKPNGLYLSTIRISNVQDLPSDFGNYRISLTVKGPTFINAMFQDSYTYEKDIKITGIHFYIYSDINASVVKGANP